MANTEIEESLLDPRQKGHHRRREEPEREGALDCSLKVLELFLLSFGFLQSSIISSIITWIAFLVIGLALPVFIIKICQSQECQGLQVVQFELSIMVFQASLSALSLLCISRNLQKHGVRNFLFIDRLGSFKPSGAYAGQIQAFFRMLLWCVLPTFLLKTIREIIRISCISDRTWQRSVMVLLGLIVSWTYLTIIFLSACILFHLVCNFQIIHINEYAKLLEKDSNAFELLEEHMWLRHRLSKISHRFRVYLIVTFLLVTTFQFITLFHTTSNSEIVNLITCGDFVVSSIVEIVGLTTCLHAAAKISHRAQGVSSVASRWHALITCSSSDGSQKSTNGVENTSANFASRLYIDYPESDSESLDILTWPSNFQLISNISSVQKRQALVMYLQSNHGGLTVFGWTIDRALINTIFCVEVSLVLFVLGKTTVLSTK